MGPAVNAVSATGAVCALCVLLLGLDKSLPKPVQSYQQ